MLWYSKRDLFAVTFLPGVTCVGLEPGAFWGFEVEVFQRSCDLLEWEPTMLQWQCLSDYVDVINSLETGSCDIGIAELAVATSLLERNITFSLPTFKTALSIVVIPDKKTSGFFSFLRPFDWVVWVMMILTAVVVGLLAWGFDWYELKYGPSAEHAPAYLVSMYDEGAKVNYVGNALAVPLAAAYMTFFTTAAFLIFLGWAFVALILVIYYGAMVTATMTVQHISSRIQTVQELKGHRVASWVGDVETLAEYGIDAVGMPWNTAQDELAMFNMLRSGTVDALVVDSALANYYAAPDCGLLLLDEAFKYADVAYAFRPGLQDTDVVRAMNSALIELLDNGATEQLVDRFLSPKLAECKTGVNSAESGETIDLSQVAGLWILFAGIATCAVIWTIVRQVIATRRLKLVDASKQN